MLERARWDASAAQARLSEYVKDEFGDLDAVPVLDETGFLKKVTILLGFSGNTVKQRAVSRTVR